MLDILRVCVCGMGWGTEGGGRAQGRAVPLGPVATFIFTSLSGKCVQISKVSVSRLGNPRSVTD